MSLYNLVVAYSVMSTTRPSTVMPWLQLVVDQCVIVFGTIGYSGVKLVLSLDVLHEENCTVIFVNPPQLVQAKFWQINDMADYTDLLQDVSYHSSCNMYIPLLRETVCEYFLRSHRIPLSVIGNLHTSSVLLLSQV